MSNLQQQKEQRSEEAIRLTPGCQPHLTCDVTAVIHCSLHIFLGLITALGLPPAPVQEPPGSTTGVAAGATPVPLTSPVLPHSCVRPPQSGSQGQVGFRML